MVQHDGDAAKPVRDADEHSATEAKDDAAEDEKLVSYFSLYRYADAKVRPLVGIEDSYSGRDPRTALRASKRERRGAGKR